MINSGIGLVEGAPRWLRRGPALKLLRAIAALRDLLAVRMAHAARLQAALADQPPDVHELLALERLVVVSEFGGQATIDLLRYAKQYQQYRGSLFALTLLLQNYFKGSGMMIDIIASNGLFSRINDATGTAYFPWQGVIHTWPWTAIPATTELAHVCIAINETATGGSTPLSLDRHKIAYLVSKWVPEHVTCDIGFCYGPARPVDYWVNPSSSTNYASWADWATLTMQEISDAVYEVPS
jgi:hypothetical protein